MNKISTFLIIFFTITGTYSQGWPQIHLPGEGMYGSICPIDENLVYLMVDNGMFYTSTDAGLNWAETNTGVPENFFDMVFFDEDMGFAVGTNGIILKTSDGGQNWDIIPSGTTENLFSIAMISLNDIWIVGHHGTVLHSTDAGNNWILDNSLSSEQLNSVEFNGNLGYIAGNNGTLLQTFDYGATWNPVSLSTTDDLFSLSITENNTQFLAGQAEVEYLFYLGDTIYKTEDNSNWTNYDVPYFMDVGISCLYFLNDNLGFYLEAAEAMCECSAMNIYKTTDSGQIWSSSYSTLIYNSNSPFMGGFSDLAFVNDSLGYAYVSSRVYKTTNGGEDWLNASGEKFNTSTFAIYPNPSRGSIIHIEFKNLLLDIYSVEIISLSGKRVSLFEKINDNQIDVSGLEEGFYFLNILKDGKKVGSNKFIKSNP